MKKTAILTLMLGMFTFGFAQPKITKVSFPNSVKIFDLYDISFQLGSYTNPYDPEIIDVYAEFVSPEGKSFKVNGFYFEGYSFQQINGHEQAQVERSSFGWRIRFTPNQIGSWNFTLHAKDQKGEVVVSNYESKTCNFHCLAVDAGNGFIRKANSVFLKRETIANGRKSYATNTCRFMGRNSPKLRTANPNCISIRASTKRMPLNSTISSVMQPETT